MLYAYTGGSVIVVAVAVAIAVVHVVKMRESDTIKVAIILIEELIIHVRLEYIRSII